MSAPNTLRTLILALLTALPALGSLQVAADEIVTPDQVDTIDDYFQDLGSHPGAPFGDWQVEKQWSRFYLQGNANTMGDDWYDPTAVPCTSMEPPEVPTDMVPTDMIPPLPPEVADALNSTPLPPVGPITTCDTGVGAIEPEEVCDGRPCHLWMDLKPESAAHGHWSLITGEPSSPTPACVYAGSTVPGASNPIADTLTPTFSAAPALLPNPAIVPEAGAHPALMDVRIFGVDANLNIQSERELTSARVRVCDIAPNGTAVIIADFTVNRQDVDDAMIFPDPDKIESAADDPLYRGNYFPYARDGGPLAIGGEDGILIPKGHSLAIDISASTLSGVARLYHYGSYFQFISDSARANIWTENRLNSVKSTFPQAALAGTADRRIEVNVVYADPWGVQDPTPNQFFWTDTDPEVPGDDTMPDQYSHDTTDDLHEGRVILRVRDITPDHTTCDPGPCFNKFVRLDPGLGMQYGDAGVKDDRIKCCSTPETTYSFAPLVYDNALESEGIGIFRYVLNYGEYAAGSTVGGFPGQPLFPNGRYQLELQDTERFWRFEHRVNIGDSGYSFEFAPGEQVISGSGLMATHQVHTSNQKTEYVLRLTNEGSAADVYGISIPAPGDGWTATVSPNSVSLLPDAFADITVTVTPAVSGPLAQAGDFKTIPVTAVSIADNSLKTRYLNTTLTGAIRHDLDLATELLRIETRPDVTTVAPITLRNNGTVQDIFALTTKGVPAGWTVSFSPASLSVLAGAREDILVTVRAPAEAVPGPDCEVCSFTLILNATLVSDQDVSDEVILPVVIYTVNDLTVTARQALWTLRDEGWGDPPLLAREVDGATRFDRIYDDSVIHRVTIANDGDGVDTYRLSASWVDGVGTDLPDCEGGADGVPDGWRFRVLDNTYVDPLGRLDTAFTPPGEVNAGPTFTATQSAQDGGIGAFKGGTQFAGEYHLGQVTLDPHTAQDVYVEMHWIEPVSDPHNPFGIGPEHECDAPVGALGLPGNAYHSEGGDPRIHLPSTVASLRLTAKSLGDSTIREVRTLGATMIGRGDVSATPDTYENRYPAALQDPEVEYGLGETGTAFAPLVDGSIAPASFQVRAINNGNEYDNLVVSVGRDVNGWVHTISAYDIIESHATAPTDGSAAHVASCQTQGTPFQGAHGKVGTIIAPATTPMPAGVRAIVCRNVGVGDEVLVTVNVQPPAKSKIGDFDEVEVEVASQSSGTLVGAIVPSDVLELRTIVQGEFQFTAETLAGERIARFGQTVALPFSIHNLGTETDAYRVTLVEGDPAWFPGLSTSAEVFVPSLRDFHGFVSAVVPSTLTFETKNGACVDHKEQFRVRLDSTLAPASLRIPQVLDFFVVVNCEDGLREMTYEVVSPGVTGRSADVVRVPFTVHDPDGSLGSVSFSVVQQQLPDGYLAVCPYIAPGDDAFPDSCVNTSGGTTPQGPAMPCQDPCRDTRGLNSNGDATGDIHVQAAANQLALSRVVVRAQVEEMTAEETITYHDALLNLASTYGVGLNLTNPLIEQYGLIIPPGLANGLVYDLKVTNTGLSPQTVVLSNSPLPGASTASTDDDWLISYSTQTVRLEAGQIGNVRVTLSAPLAVDIGDKATVLVTATVQEDTTKVATRALVAEVGEFGVRVDAPLLSFPVMPQAVQVFPVTVTNLGNVDDIIRVKVELPAIYEDRFEIEWLAGCDYVEALATSPDANACFVGQGAPGEEGVDALAPGQAKQLLVRVTLPSGIVSGNELDFPVTVQSVLGPAAIASANLRMTMLKHVAQDVDGDDQQEYAVDADQVEDNGYELFLEDRETRLSREDTDELNDVGVFAQAAALERFLSDAARDERTVDVLQQDGSTLPTFAYGLVDGDGDLKQDHFVDTSSDGLPDLYWDPDSTAVTQLRVTLDVTSDGVREQFVDVDGDTLLDTYFDLVEGEFGCAEEDKPAILRRYINEDDTVDYVVDLNCNGNADAKEPVLIASVGGLGTIAKIIQRVDMDGDGELDEVVDIDGDGNPDYFIPAGSTTAIPIVLRDVTGDGVADWTYAADGQGKPDSYYDPATGKAGFIDTQAQFVRDLKEYWYIGALFGLVLVLFVVLVAVTRR